MNLTTTTTTDRDCERSSDSRALQEDGTTGKTLVSHNALTQYCIIMDNHWKTECALNTIQLVTNLWCR